jgi:hypothetical protein
MADNVGCVCEPYGGESEDHGHDHEDREESRSDGTKRTGATAGGMAAIVMQADTQRRNQQQNYQGR